MNPRSATSWPISSADDSVSSPCVPVPRRDDMHTRMCTYLGPFMQTLLHFWLPSCHLRCHLLRWAGYAIHISGPLMISSPGTVTLAGPQPSAAQSCAHQLRVERELGHSDPLERDPGASVCQGGSAGWGGQDKHWARTAEQDPDLGSALTSLGRLPVFHNSGLYLDVNLGGTSWGWTRCFPLEH